MNYIQYMKPGGNFGDKLKTGIKKFLKAAGEASRMAKDARINNPGAAMIRDAYAKGDEKLAKLLTDEMQAANLTGIALGSGAAPLITGFTVAPVTTGVTLATGMTGGMAGMYGTDKAINYFSDGKYTGWGNWINQATNGAIGENTAGFFHPGAIFGGFATGKIGNKIVGVTNQGKLELLNSALNKNILATTLQPTVADEAVLRGQLGWAPKQTIPYRHGSLDPELQTFVPKYDRWDVTTHGADPYMYFVTDQSTPVSAANMMDLRPYQYTGNIVAEKPMVQVGDFNVAGKNATRNQLISRARQQGADAYLLQDIVDNKVPHLNVVARFIGPEGEAVQGGAASIKWYGPTMGKTTAVKVSNKLVDIDPLLKPIRAKHAERLGLKISDPKVSADPAYKQEVADFVLEWRANPENQGKTLVASTKHLLDPQYKVEFANEPSIPDFETFAARNKARGFKETDEQLRAWYNSILELGRDLNVDNRYVSDIESGTRSANISEAERLGIPKGDRGNLSRFQKEALEDLTTYRNKWIHQKYPLLDNNGNIIWSNGTNKSFLDTYVAPLKGDQYKGVLLYPHIEDDGSFLMRMSMGSDDLNGGFAGYDGASAITLTSPKMNAINLEIPIPIEQASPTLPKDGVKTFWSALQDIAQPGSYISGDFGGRPLGYNLIRQYNKIGTPIVSTTNTGVKTITGRNGYLNVINELFRKIPWKSHYDGLSTDSYMALLKLGNRPGYKLRFSKDGFTNWNHLSFENKYILDLYEQALTDPTKLQEFLKVFHDWVAPYGGHDAVIKNGKIIIPQPFILRQKQGGTIKIKKKNKGKFTEYCGGKVTEECIRKGKNSSNPTTRKRANFAANARKWKHEEGGKINYLNYFK